jgi:asparagine synthase (glutamine-hydrolysing)
VSAIFGILQRDGKLVEPDQMTRMSRILEPHGPDDHGFTIQENAGIGYRLRRFTPEDQYERQPISCDGAVWLVSDARIDNRRELGDELGISASEASSMPDSMFIRHAWHRWGPECPRHMTGAYSFAVYDSRNQSLLLVRSPRGASPVLYVEKPGIFAFATAPKALFATSGRGREINLSRLADFLLIRPSDPGVTFYKGVESLPGGFTLRVSRDSLEMRRYWSPDGLRPIRYRKDEDYAEAFCSLFDRVVQDQLRSASPVGIMLSGGLDSASIAASAALSLRGGAELLHAFTEVPEDTGELPSLPGRYSDETPLVKVLGKKYPNIELNFVRTAGGFYFDGIDRFFEAAETPMRNASNRVWIEAIQQRAADRNIRVILNGSMGNLTISWDGSELLPKLIRAGRLLRALAEARGLAREGRSRSTIRALAGGFLFLLPDPLWQTVNRLRTADSQSGDEVPWEVYSPISRVLVSDLGLHGRNLRSRPRFGMRMQPLGQRGLSSDTMRGHQAMFGVQSRVPADDQRIVEFCLSIPEEQFLRDGTDRWLVRRAFSERLPVEILCNKRRGLQAGDWLNRLTLAYPQVVKELDRLDDCPLARYAIDLPRVRTLAKGLSSGDFGAGPEALRQRTKMDLGLMTGRFLRWFDSHE